MEPVELKVKASTAAAAVSGLALYILGRYVFRGAVPDVVTSWVYAIVPALLTFAAGYAAKHTSRTAGTATVTVNTTATSGAEIGRQVVAAMKADAARGGRRNVSTAVPDPPAPPASVTPPP